MHGTNSDSPLASEPSLRLDLDAAFERAQMRRGGRLVRISHGSYLKVVLKNVTCPITVVGHLVIYI